MEALYAWLRVTDDFADVPGDLDLKRARLTDWRSHPPHPIFPAFQDTIRRFQIPEQYFRDLLDGVESDLAPRLFGTFESLEPYCYRVAGTVGLACCAIWGVRDAVARKPAEAAGTAFQLTNILRDVGEDRRDGRVYLPVDDLRRFECQPDAWGATMSFRRLMRFQISRARNYYRESDALVPLLPKPGRRMFLTIRGIYEDLLSEIERRPEAVLSRRLRVNSLKKAWIMLKTVSGAMS